LQTLDLNDKQLFTLLNAVGVYAHKIDVSAQFPSDLGMNVPNGGSFASSFV
jgi:hypothetical protein